MLDTSKKGPMNKGSIVERLCSDLDRKEPRYKSPTLLNIPGWALSNSMMDYIGQC